MVRRKLCLTVQIQVSVVVVVGLVHRPLAKMPMASRLGTLSAYQLWIQHLMWIYTRPGVCILYTRSANACSDGRLGHHGNERA